MNPKIYLALALCAAGTQIQGAEHAVFSRIDATKLPAASRKTSVTYAQDVKPLFEASCIRCHGQERPKAGLRLDSLEAVLKGGEEGKILVPGNSAKSLVIVAASQIDEETAMPPKKRPNPPGQAGGQNKGPGGPPPKPLTPEQVGLLRAWIDQGAK